VTQCLIADDADDGVSILLLDVGVSRPGYATGPRRRRRSTSLQADSFVPVCERRRRRGGSDADTRQAAMVRDPETVENGTR